MKDNNYSVLETIEKERQRIAVGLHDDVVQNLIYLTQQTEIIKKYLDKDLCAASLELEEMRSNLKNIISELRDTIYDLRPYNFDDIGWRNAFTKLESDLQKRKDWNVIFFIDQVSGVSQLMLMTIYRIVKEACTNSYKHSNANHLSVDIKQDNDYIKIVIEDDGVGFDNNTSFHKKHFGLREMFDSVSLLGGEIDIKSNKGTLITIQLPISQEVYND